MITTILQQAVLLFAFFIASFFMFTFPGLGIIRFLKIKLPGRLDLYALSTILGLCSFTLLTYILSLLHIRNFIWIFILLGFYVPFKYRGQIRSVLIKIKEKLFSLITIILVTGVIGMVSINAASGLNYSQGMLFWSAHGHDGVWHMALIEQMRQENFPFTNPEYANQKLQNYHFFIDLLMSEISRILSFSSSDLYFRLMPVLLSVLLGLMCFSFVRRWSGKYISGLWSMVFVFFLGNFGFIVTLFRSGNLNGESVFWIPQLFSVQGNPPQAAAVVIMAALAYCTLIFLRDKERKLLLPVVILGSTLVEFKVYAAVVFFGALLLVGIYELLLKRNFYPAVLFLITLIPAALISLPNSFAAGSYLIFEPWWFVRTMVVATDKLNLLDWELRRQTYLYENNFKRVVQLELTAFAIYAAGNFGVRVIGLVQAVKMLAYKKIFRDSFDLYFLSTILLSFGIPLLFLQKGVAYNIIQMSQYALLFLSFLSALTMGEVFTKVRAKWGVILISVAVVILGIPTQIGLLWGFYSNSPITFISNSQIEALSFLKRNSSSLDVILTSPYDEYKKEKYSNLPLPINVWADTGYVSAITSRRTLITDHEQIEIMGYEADKLSDEREEAFKSKDYGRKSNFLEKNKVKYIYLEKGEEFADNSAKLDISLIYNKDDIKIYKVNNI